MVHGTSKIAEYLNTHPMFQTKRYGGCTAVPDFFNFYESHFEERKGKNARFWKKIDNAIWYSWDFRHITKEDCDKFFKEIIEPLWCKFYKVKSSGFFEAQLPAVPKGILSIPSNIC